MPQQLVTVFRDYGDADRGDDYLAQKVRGLVGGDAASPALGTYLEALGGSGTTGTRSPPGPWSCGAALLAALFPTGSSTNWEEVYESLRMIVREELIEDLIPDPAT